MDNSTNPVTPQCYQTSPQVGVAVQLPYITIIEQTMKLLTAVVLQLLPELQMQFLLEEIVVGTAVAEA